ncbi:MAG: hypothetical protein U0326_22705 [Polyangiales bacterium]
MLVASALLASCTSGGTLSGADPVAVRVCPESIRISERGNPVGLISGHIRHCWPGEAYCFCDTDDDCYAEDGYTPCTPPVADAGPVDADPVDVATVDVETPDADPVDAATVDAETVDAESDAATVDIATVDTATVDTATVDTAITDAGSVDVAPVDAAVDVTVVDTAVADVSVEDVSVLDVAVEDASPDVSAVDAATTDTAPADAGNVCPEAVRISAAGNIVGVISGHIRQCWPGEARCFCDRDNDCYAESGYVPCTPPGAVTDSGAADAAVADVAVDVATDTGSVTDTPVTDVAVDTGSVADATVSGAGPLAPDPVSYAGSFAGGTGYYMARLTVSGEGRDVWVYAPASRGANPPLMVAFHGTNADGDVMINDSGLRALADAQGLIVVAPTSRWFGGEGGDYDHPGGNGTYWETRNVNPDTNPDLLLARAVMVEAHRRYNTDVDRVYSIGHSNGGFMSLLVSVALRDRIAAFAENSAGMVTCSSRPACYFEGSSLTCGGLSMESGWCGCSGPGLPVDLPTSGRQVPGYLTHGAQDPIVSVFYTCALGSRMSALGIPVEVSLHHGGHDLSVNFARNAWPFLSRFRRQ